jgi:glycosyltransferase involved in cell wall biosynthesis
MDKPLVSVRTLTYNHEKYIEKCLDGVLMQKTKFKYEYIIGEDCSRDKTREIVNAYAEKYPDIIKLVTSDTNVGIPENSRRTRVLCNGKYQALCEGDDYWTDPYKLQKQVDFLEKNNECTVCFHKAEILSENNLRKNQKYFPFFRPKIITDIKDILKENYIATCTVMYRTKLFDEFPEWFSKLAFGDWSIHILNAQYGKIGFIDQPMSVYRLHSTGTWSSLFETNEGNIKAIKNILDAYDAYDKHFNYKYRDIIDLRRRDYYIELAVSNYLLKQNKESLDNIKYAYEYSLKCHNIPFARLLLSIYKILSYKMSLGNKKG